MDTEYLFSQALGLSSPWKVTQVDFSSDGSLLTISIDFIKGSRFPDPTNESDDDVDCAVHDTVERSWEHLNFFQHRTVLKARVPRIKNGEGKVKTVRVPWANPNSGFTLLMEAYLLGLVKVLSVAEVSRRTQVSERRIWRLVETRIFEAWKKTCWGSLTRLGVDETSTKKGHNYGTAFLELEGQEDEHGKGAARVARLLFFTPGKNTETFDRFMEELESRGLPPAQIEEIAMDMSHSFIKGAKKHFPESQICFDRFHVMKLCGKACEEVRNDVIEKFGPMEKGALWALRGNAERLSEKRKQLRENLCAKYEELGEAHAIRDFLADTWNYATQEDASEHLEDVISMCKESELKPLKKLAKSLERYFDGIMGYYKNFSTSAAIEAVNGLIQLAKRRARGYRNFSNFQAIVYWIAGRLELQVPRGATH